METYPQTNCYPGQVDTEQELCVGGKPKKPKIAVYEPINQKVNGFNAADVSMRLVDIEGGGNYDFYGYSVRKNIILK